MKYWLITLCLLFCLSSVSAATGDYILGSGDILNISVWGLTDLTIPDINVRPDGKITVPLIGEIVVTGMTVAELSLDISNKLSHYYENPVVTINVVQQRTTRVYVVGQVNRPGAYELDKSRNLMDAIGAAQGWSQDALKKKVYIIRSGEKDKPLIVNLMDLLKKGDTSKNYALNEGDIVYLTESDRIDIVRDIVPLVNPLYLIHHWERAP